MDKLRQRTISLGHGGEITLEVTQEGVILDKEGPDFAIYENPIRIGDNIVYQEFAHVGVAFENKPESYKWFPCIPQKSIVGCAGVVPTDQGGDLFDLKTLKIEKIRFIKIRDTGTNISNFGKNTEGFDLDSLSLINAYQEIIPEPSEEDLTNQPED